MRRCSSTNWPPSVQSPTAQNQYNLLSNMDIPSADGPPNWAQVYRALLHQTSRTYWEMRRPSPANWPQVNRALLHQTSRTYWEMRRPTLLIEPKCTEPYYTKPVELIEKYGYTQCRQTPNWAQVYRALLHQTSRTYWEMRRPSPANQPQVYRALLHETSRTYADICIYPVQMDPPIVPKCTEPY